MEARRRRREREREEGGYITVEVSCMHFLVDTVNCNVITLFGESRRDIEMTVIIIIT